MLVSEILHFPDDTEVLLRRGIGTPPGKFEVLVEQLAQIFGYSVRWFLPTGHGREGVFFRDYEMVQQADRVLVYFTPGRSMTGGTGHLAEAAINVNVPMKAFEVDGDGFFVVGEYDPTQC